MVDVFRIVIICLVLAYIYIYIYTHELVLVCKIQECSMSYRQSEMYKLTTYLKDLPQQSVLSKKNLQVVDKFRTCELFLCSKNKRGRVGV